MRGRRTIGLFVWAFALFPTEDVSAAQAPTNVIQLVGMIQAAQDDFVRDDLASQLPDMVDRQKANPADPAMVDAIAALLTDSLDIVRASSADALGRIGPSAARAVPLLAGALRRGEEEFIRPGELRPSYFSGDAICDAFKRIGQTPTGASCRDGLYSYRR